MDYANWTHQRQITDRDLFIFTSQYLNFADAPKEDVWHSILITEDYNTLERYFTTLDPDM